MYLVCTWYVLEVCFLDKHGMYLVCTWYVRKVYTKTNMVCTWYVLGMYWYIHEKSMCLDKHGMYLVCTWYVREVYTKTNMVCTRYVLGMYWYIHEKRKNSLGNSIRVLYMHSYRVVISVAWQDRHTPWCCLVYSV
jgi:hypothetical protein